MIEKIVFAINSIIGNNNYCIYKIRESESYYYGEVGLIENNFPFEGMFYYLSKKDMMPHGFLRTNSNMYKKMIKSKIIYKNT